MAATVIRFLSLLFMAGFVHAGNFMDNLRVEDSQGAEPTILQEGETYDIKFDKEGIFCTMHGFSLAVGNNVYRDSTPNNKYFH